VILKSTIEILFRISYTFVFIFKPASFQEKGFIVSCESVCPEVCCRRSEDTGRKVTFIVHEIDVKLSPDDDWVAANLVSRRYF